MSPTTIAPSLGQSPEWLQLGPGASALYGAIDMRRVMLAGRQEGILGSTGGAYKVSLSSGMILTVAASTGDGALVLGDSVAAQGLYYVPPHSAAITETVTAAHATLPRIDMVVLEVLDATHDGGASNLARVRIIAGTATSGATLDNRTGAAALPASTIRLADVLVPAAAASILAANIRDRRPRAAGVYRKITRTANAAAGNDYATAGTTFASLDATNLRPRIECSGTTLRLKFMGVLSHGTAGGVVVLVPWQDGAVPENTSSDWFQFTRDTNLANLAVQWSYEWSPSPGSHLLEWAWRTLAGSASIITRPTFPMQLVLEEILRDNTDNT
jgi:hypothetical protein